MKDTQTVSVFQLQRKISKYRNPWKRFICSMIYHWILRTVEEIHILSVLLQDTYAEYHIMLICIITARWTDSDHRRNEKPYFSIIKKWSASHLWRSNTLVESCC